ncbi:hypothetical protein CDL12_11441 [Handroanthus impetiginosus]|uniref:GTD-binding domain-containing protein n=1 Tax=Handroanthus impetiginosus TaxID=429701 RepID=A0A2G9HEG2_9LAMI|nr:hypothetical protein CDL12_11441 [Handroanthus impetiginosus]
MAAEISSVRKSKHNGFMTLLSYAACEWFLIFLLFVDEVFSYLLTVVNCKILVLYAQDSICLALYIINLLMYVHGMCDECLVPTVIQNKSNSESRMLLVGKLWVDVERSVVQNLMLNKHTQLGSLGRRIYSCCNKSWRAKSNTERLPAFNPVGLRASKANVEPPLPHVPCCSRFSRRGSFKRQRDKFSRPMIHDGVGTLSKDDVGSGRREILKALHHGSDVDDQCDHLELDQPKNVNSLSSGVLRELNWKEVYHKPSPQLTTEVISLDDDPQLSDLGTSGSSELSELFSLQINPLSSDNITIANKRTPSDYTCLSEPEGKNLTDSLCQNAQNMELSCLNAAEHIDASGPSRTEQDTKSPSEESASEVGLLLKDEDSSSMKRNDLSYESLYQISVSDIEGEDIVDQLRRQVEHDRSCIKSLYMELEEERNAAAVAANEAMAMITRLQEEKATLHMEALQYVQMMEAQAKYDMDSLEIAHDPLAAKEKDLQDLIPNGVNFEEIEDLCPNREILLEFEIEETTHDKVDDGCHEKSDKLSENLGATNVAFFENEIAVLKDRLQALEIDRDFLKHASNLLRNEKDRVRLIDKIAHQLQELWKMESKRR